MRLSLSVSGATLAVTFAGDTLARKLALPYDAAATAATARAIVDVLARGNRARALSDKNLADLAHHGETLWRTLVPAELHKELLRGDALTLELDEALVAVPWELMFDGTQFLCRRLAIGRLVATRTPRRGDERRAVGTPIRILVMAADPRGDLAAVREEGEAIVDALEPQPAARARLSTAPDRAFALRYLKDYDVVHFAGHADYVAGQPGQSGWLLADGKLTADEIAALGGGRPMPMVVFSNACQSGHTEAWDGDPAQVLGLANAFLTAGVRHYIGTQWEVVDGQSALFAAALYRELASGQAIGAAVRNARNHVVTSAGAGALAWASYVLYGDPEVRPLHRPEQRVKLSIPSAAKIAARASAPWKRPVATASRARLPDGAREDGKRGDGRRGDGKREDGKRGDGRREHGARRDGAVGDQPPARRRLPAWLPAALGGAAVGLVGVGVVAWLAWRQPAMSLHPTVRGVAVLPLSTGAAGDDQKKARELEWCLPLELTRDHVAVVAPEKLMTPAAQTNGVMDKDSARRFGLAVGARWVLYGNLVAGTANLFVAEVVNDLVLYADSFPVDDAKRRCQQFAAAVAAHMRRQPP